MLAGLDGKANALVLQTDLLGEIAICQLSGSLTHTAYALLSDLVTVRRRLRQRRAKRRLVESLDDGPSMIVTGTTESPAR